MGLFDFLKKKPKEELKVVAVKGELKPGWIDVDLGTFNESGEAIPYPTVSKSIKITPVIRPTVNRILAGVESKEDLDVLDMRIKKDLWG